MRFSIRDLAISTALLSFYLAALTRLWRALLAKGQGAALFGAALVLTIVIAQILQDEFRYRFKSETSLLRIYRPQYWPGHYLIATPVIALSIAALNFPFNGFWTMMTLYWTLCAFSVHLFVCLTPLVSFTSDGVVVNGKPWRWRQRRVRLIEQDAGMQLQVAATTPIKLPSDRVEEVRAILEEWLPDEPQQTNLVTEAPRDAIPSP